MKTIKLKKDIDLTGIKCVIITNELTDTVLEQSKDASLHLTSDIFVRSSLDVESVVWEDLLEVISKENEGTVEVILHALEPEKRMADILRNSELTVSVPQQIKIEANSVNGFISASNLKSDLNIACVNGALKVDNCVGDFSFKNENGSIKLFKLSGDLTIRQRNGSVSADYLTGTNLEASSENGSMKFRDCRFRNTDIRNENGSVFYESLPVESGSINITNETGSIHLALSPLQGFNLEAHAVLGQIKNSFMGEETTMFDNYILQNGDQSLKINLNTQLGTIKISSTDVLGTDFFHGKLDHVKELIIDNTEQGWAEILRIISQLTQSLEKLRDKIAEEPAREKLQRALDQLKAWREKIENPELRDSVKESFDTISKDVGRTIQDALKTAQEALLAMRGKYKEEFKPQISMHIKHGKEFFHPFRTFSRRQESPSAHASASSEEAAQEKARMKILEMLEEGKITAEEAEKLLKAIH